jgi:hypothetical protein
MMMMLSLSSGLFYRSTLLWQKTKATKPYHQESVKESIELNRIELMVTIKSSRSVSVSASVGMMIMRAEISSSSSSHGPSADGCSLALGPFLAC